MRGYWYRRLCQRCLPLVGLTAVIALSLPTFSGCDLGTYSKRSAEYLKENPDGIKKKKGKKKVSVAPLAVPQLENLRSAV